jgi:hypothetical protein
MVGSARGDVVNQLSQSGVQSLGGRRDDLHGCAILAMGPLVSDVLLGSSMDGQVEASVGDGGVGGAMYGMSEMMWSVARRGCRLRKMFCEKESLELVRLAMVGDVEDVLFGCS